MITVNFELIKKIREHINRTEKQAEMLVERKKWLQLTSAIIALEDTACAVQFYISSQYPEDVNGKYLYTYGLLQALFVQMDAVNHICISLFNKKVGFEENYPEAYKVREMRNDVAGHPTNRQGHYFTQLAQFSMNKCGFYYIKHDSEGDFEETQVITVDIREAIEETAQCVNDSLEKAIERLDEEFKCYINAHRGRKMKEIFKGLDYIRAKMYDNDIPGLADCVYAETKEMVGKCEEELKIRYGSVNAVHAYKYLLEQIHELYDLIDNDLPQIQVEVRKKLEKYLFQNLFSKLEELESYCEETDCYFKACGRNDC